MKHALFLEDRELSDIKRGRMLEVMINGEVVLIGARQSKEYKVKLVAARAARVAHQKNLKNGKASGKKGRLFAESYGGKK